MAALNTDKFKKLARRWCGSIGSGGVADAAVTTIPLSSSTNLPTDTAVVAVIDRVDANGTTTASLEESVIGVVSGNNLVTCTRGVEGTAQAHSAGAVVEILITAKGLNDLIDGILVQHDQAGKHTWDNWMPANETWTYASATTITVPSGAASKYGKGDKIKLTQTTVKYFYVVGVADTVLTITGGTSYTLTNAAITANYYSKVGNPQGFPDWFAWTPTLSATDPMTYGTTTISYARFSLKGKTCNTQFKFKGTTGGTASASITFSLPITAFSIFDPQASGACHGHDGATIMLLLTDIGGNKNLGRLIKPGFANFALGADAGAGFGGSLIYEIA